MGVWWNGALESFSEASHALLGAIAPQREEEGHTLVSIAASQMVESLPSRSSRNHTKEDLFFSPPSLF